MRRDMNIKSCLLSVHLLIEEDEDEAERIGWPTESLEEVEKAVLAAVAVLLRHRPHVKVEYASGGYLPLDDKPEFGRCVVCDRWVIDMESPIKQTEIGLCYGAKTDGQFRCDEHLPHGHPLCFAGQGYDGPVPDQR